MDSRWVAALQEANWLPGGELEIRGWAYLKGVASEGPGRVVLELAEPASGKVLRLNAESVAEPEINATSADQVDHTWAAFVVRLGAEVPRRWPTAGKDTQARLDVQIEMPTAEGTYRGPFTMRNDAGSAGALRPGAWNGSGVVTPTWAEPNGLRLTLETPLILAVDAEWAEGESYLAVKVHDGYLPVHALLEGPEPAPATLYLEPAGPEGLRVRIAVHAAPHSDTTRRAWAMTLVDSSGRPETLRWARPDLGDPVALGGGLLLDFLGNGTVRLSQNSLALIVTSAERVDGPEPSLRVTGTLSDPGMVVRSVRLSGRRLHVPAAHWDVTVEGTLHAVIPLAYRSWDSQVRPLPVGRYALQLDAESGQAIEPRVGPSCLGAFGRREYGRVHNTRLSRKGGRLVIELSAPLARDEIGRYNQRRLRSEAAQASNELVGTYFGSWFGRNASDNPLAIYREMSSRGLGEPYTWEVTDLSVAIPEGCVAAVVGSREWWRASTSARHVVTNVWQRSDFLKRDGQVVVQTWHGTPYKLLGLDRPTKAGRPESVRKIQRDTAQWDHLVSQNHYSSQIYRRAYLWDRPIMETGYPRNDVLGLADPTQRARIRHRLGLGENETAVLYAPTWREDNRSTVGVLDLPRVSSALGPGFRILLRGHSITLRTGKPIHADAVVDVTTYPDPSELMLAADVLVTDYSSIMFDFSVTGRPILFYVPDLGEYAGTAKRRTRRQSPSDTASASYRGVYFDLAAIAPGPLLTTEATLISTLRALSEVRRKYAEAYRSWQATFNALEDGAASRRVVDEIFRDLEGLVP